MPNIKILVSGSNGQVGNELKEARTLFPDFDITFTTRQELDLEREDSIKAILQNSEFDYFINTAAYTAVDKAESERASAFAVNGMALYHISNHLPEKCTLIHISSDYVYHNNINTPLSETDPCNPKGVYAMSKHQGEEFVLASDKKAIILRTSWVYSSFGHNFVKTMLRLGKEKDKLSIVSDQIGAPTYAKDISHVILEMIEKMVNSNEDYSGIYNFSNNGQTHWAEFAKTIFTIKGIDCEVDTISTEAYGAAAPRPLWSVLSTEKIKSKFGIKIRNWEESLKECLSKLA